MPRRWTQADLDALAAGKAPKPAPVGKGKTRGGSLKSELDADDRDRLADLRRQARDAGPSPCYLHREGRLEAVVSAAEGARLLTAGAVRSADLRLAP